MRAVGPVEFCALCQLVRPVFSTRDISKMQSEEEEQWVKAIWRSKIVYFSECMWISWPLAAIMGFCKPRDLTKVCQTFFNNCDWVNEKIRMDNN